ncbi:MAG: GDP-mannose 4,6-dehydratase, partial [Deltaproteobacteria bacterium]|nr:GDP-mannose 4,6-dehydratase [Deltaproteobacteria bacterium]
MKNMLVTGGCGFIGSNFIRYLLEESDFSGRVINVDKLTYAGNPESLSDIERKFPDRYHFIKADICDQ